MLSTSSLVEVAYRLRATRISGYNAAIIPARQAASAPVAVQARRRPTNHCVGGCAKGMSMMPHNTATVVNAVRASFTSLNQSHNS